MTYDPSTNMLTGVAYDMNTGQSASFTLNLNGYYKPPSNGTYVFGVGAVTGEHFYADWALLYVAMTMKPAPSPSLVSTWVEVVVLIIAAAVIVVVVVLIVALLMIKRGKR